MNRRAVVVGAAGVVAAAAGIGVATWRGRRQIVPTALWTVELPRSGGGALALRSFRGHPLLVNFWATWCVPCVVEMPLLQHFRQANAAKGWEVVGIAVDQGQPVAAFVAAHAIRFPVVLGGLGAVDLSRDLGNEAGGLPFSVAIAGDGRLLGRRLGAVDPTVLAEWVAANG